MPPPVAPPERRGGSVCRRSESLCNTRPCHALFPSGIELEYVTTGDPADPLLLVVNGYTSQMISWQQGYIDQLAAQGLFVIQFDNRDVGLSTKLDGQTRVARRRADGITAG